MRGVLTGTAHHGFFIAERAGLAPCPGVPRPLREVPGAAVLMFQDYEGVALTSEERRSNETFRRQLGIGMDWGEFKPFRIEVRGTLLVAKDARISLSPDGSPEGDAFGPRGAYRLLIVVKSIRRL